MSHEISLLDTVVTNTGTDRAWHKLDKQVELNGLSNDEFASRSGMSHQVDCIQLSRSDSGLNLPGYYGVFSSLNPEMFRVVGEKTSLIQPASFAAWGNITASQLGGKIVSAGTIKGTRLAFVSIDMGKKITLPGGDELKQFITFTISWDGTYKVMAVAMDYRTVCNNTYPSPECADRMSLYEHKGHNGFDPQQAADQVTMRYQNAIESEKQKYADVIGKLADTQFDLVADKSLLRFASVMADGKAVIDRIIKLDDDYNGGTFLDKCLAATIDGEAWSKVKTTGLSNVGKTIIAETLNGVGSQLDSAKDTLWGALNAYTYWTDHLAVNDDGRGRKSDTPLEERKQENVLFNNFGPEKQNAILLLSAIANAS